MSSWYPTEDTTNMKVCLIDADTRTRTKPMRILVLGLPRTGTTSILSALRKLSYTPHSMREILSNAKQIPLWQEGVDLTLLTTEQRPMRKRNRNIFPPYGKQEFDKLLGEYDVCADLPSALFFKELVEAYPDAKVVLTHRKYEDWEASMQDSIWLLLKWKLFIITRKLNLTQMAPLNRLMHSLFFVHNGNHYGGPQAREAYEKYYEDVRDLVPANNLLEIESGKGDWKPLVEFLGEDQKKVETLGPYPNMEESVSMEKGLRTAWWHIMEWIFLFAFLIGFSALGFVVIKHQDVIWDKFESYLELLVPYLGLEDDDDATGTVSRATKAVVETVTEVVKETVVVGKDEL